MFATSGYHTSIGRALSPVDASVYIDAEEMSSKEPDRQVSSRSDSVEASIITVAVY